MAYLISQELFSTGVWKSSTEILNVLKLSNKSFPSEITGTASPSIGYRQIDTAQAYMNEVGIGEGIRSCGVAREERFITTKVVAEAKTYDATAQSIDASLAKLGWIIFTF
ncbi:aldo/keto reductase [Neobacillus drentensis]|uniref:aldo/keto reductase n=1 Tax=Neobacillus drentensis TaxID=220684 RepID=UPI001F3E32FE|nr:aldo/keto reductase [Neobacillus drentensis]ULT54489.1 aldo/keto reductase [Neobacillus drentensis]